VLLCLLSLSCSGCCQHLSTDLARKTPIRKRVANRVDYLHKDHIKDSVCIINESINQSTQHSVRNKMLKSDLRLLWLTFDRPKSVSLMCPVFDSSMLSGFKSLFHQNNTHTHTYICTISTTHATSRWTLKQAQPMPTHFLAPSS